VRQAPVRHHGKRVRFYSTVELVNALEQEKATGKQGQFVYRLRYVDLVILDEIHHAGTDSAWGKALERAFGNAARRLCLSGTPFRKGDSFIPFVRYVESEEAVTRRGEVVRQTVYSCHADYEYGYDKALDDGVCRPLHFPNLDGTFEWWSGEDDIDLPQGPITDLRPR